MTALELTQAEADSLLALAKRRADEDERELPNAGGRVTAPLVSADGREEFSLDIWGSRIDLLKGRYQARGRQVVVLARLDFGGQPHRNPNDEEIGSPHLHLFREGFGDKWAFPVPVAQFQNLADRWTTLLDFMRFCNIVDPPRFRRGLFS